MNSKLSWGLRCLITGLVLLPLTCLGQSMTGGGGGAGAAGCSPAGSAGQLLSDNGSGGCTSNVTGTGVLTALGVAVGSAGAPVLFNGAGGTPSSLVLTNATGLPNSGLVAQTANTVLGALTTTSPSGLAVPSCSTAASALQWTSGTGFGCNSAITASAVPLSGITGLGTGVGTALGIAVGSAGGPVTFNGALGTPSSGTATNLTGLPIGGITGLGTGVATALAAAVTGSGSIVLATSPSLITPALGTPSAVDLLHGTDLPNSSVNGITLGTGTSVSLASPRQYYVCTGTCTVTPPVPVASNVYEFCVMNGDNVATVITMAAIGSSARYENTTRTAYGTAGTGTMVSGGAVGDKLCIVSLDSTHYLTTSFNGTWTTN